MKKPVYIEVTNTLLSSSWTGIQRVTAEVIRGLVDLAVDVRLIKWDTRSKGFRMINENEFNLLIHDGPSRKTIVSKIWNKVSRYAAKSIHRLDIQDFESQAIFFDIEASWHNPMLRSELLTEVTEKGLQSVQLHYDLIPFLYPAYTPLTTRQKFYPFMKAHFEYTNTYLCISQSSANDLKSHLKRHDLYKDQVIKPIQLGSNFWSEPVSLQNGLKKHDQFLLVVGTIEVRKNRSMILDVFEKVEHKFPEIHLVFVGKEGWLVEETKDRITQHHLYNKKIFWYRELGDAALSYLYQNAQLLIEPSWYEGYGLSLVEALAYKIPVLSSNRGALPEAGGDYAVYFDPDDPGQLKQLLIKALSDSSFYNQLKQKLKNYKPHSWEETAKQVIPYLN